MKTSLQHRVRPGGGPGLLPQFQHGLLQRKCACGGSPGLSGECAECQKKRLSLQRKPIDRAEEQQTAPPIVHEVLCSAGRPLDDPARSFMESRFGHDFSRVRVHTDSRAAESARAVAALAYTVGRDVVFGAGQYEAATSRGRQLLAHELAHVMQQGQTEASSRDLTVQPANDGAERQAEAAAQAVDGSQPAAISSGLAFQVQRIPIPSVPPPPPTSPRPSSTPSPTATPCPRRVRLGTVRQFNHSNLPAATRDTMRTYLGALTRLELEPRPDHRGHCMQEQVSLFFTDCPSALTDATRPCSGHQCLPVGRAGSDARTGTSMSAGRTQILDLHRSSSSRSLLEGTGVNSCSVVCLQTYRCDSDSGPRVDGLFLIRRDYQAGTHTLASGATIHITTGSVTKEDLSPPSSQPGDFPQPVLPAGQDYASAGFEPQEAA